GHMKFNPKFDYIWDFDKFQYGLDYSNSKLTRAEFKRKEHYINSDGKIISEIEVINSKIDYLELEKILSKEVEKKQVWDKAEWSYDGVLITKKGAIKPFYFILKWFKNNELLTEEGIKAY